MAEKKKCRQYSNEYLKYGFIPSPTSGQLPSCVVCEKAFSNETIKPSRLRDHFAKMHSDKAGKPISFFQGLMSKFENCSTIGKLFGKSSLNADKGLLTSYKVSLLIAQCGKSHSIGETLVLPAVKEIVSTMLGPDTCAIVKLIPLSNDIVSRRIDKMATDVEETLLDNIVAKHLCERLHDSLCYIIINAVNKIKEHSLNERLFRKLSQDHDEEYECLLLHIEVRWLSRRKCLRHFYKPYKLRDADLDVFCSHLKQAKEDMQTRLHDLCILEIPTRVLNPFSADAGEFHPRSQEELIDLKHDSEAQALFQKCGYECFWVKVKNSYPILWQEVKLLVLAFPSTYLVERSFSVVQQLLTKVKNKLQICVGGDLRLRLTKIEPDIVRLASAY
ncbi:hypothetical protein GDO78_016401 [Eleutherodactylus coqui]|uniref:SCAN domain-containing protein 3 n=1 Tax=Eleutherodactylus coqui TaxID=57060 RepID=A0A8J6EAG3_ELECQ|nr:hypothetical protein GDO78_016401 [Eleutherodactylus coqui]